MVITHAGEDVEKWGLSVLGECSHSGNSETILENSLVVPQKVKRVTI